MKHMCFMLTLFVFQSTASTYAQHKKIDLEVRQSTLKQIFKEIESKTEFTFFYNDRIIDLERVVDIQVKNETIEKILNKLLTDCSFVIENKNILLISKEMLQSSSVLSEKRTITGSVTDAEGEPIIGANVIQQGTTNGTVTNIDGKFSISVPDNAILQVSFIGYVSQSIPIKNQTVFQITLADDVHNIEEVVVVGYGVQRKVNLTGAVGVATAKDLQSKAAINALEALQGVIPNFNINYANGEPGKEPDINVRGYASISEDGGPLIVIDGVNSDSYMLSRMNSEDIESISVLKDAASAAIYGARAAFGVVLVTTKSGSRNMEKVSVNFTSNLIRSTPTKRPKMTNAYVHASTVNEALRRRGEPTRFKEEDVEKMRLYHLDPLNYPSEEITPEGDYYYWGTIDYIDESFTKSAYKWRNNLNISGGTKKTDYYLSAGYTTDEGFYKYNNLNIDIYSIKAKVNTSITDWWTVGLNTDFVKEKQKYPHSYHPNGWWDFVYGQRNYFNIINPDNGYYTNNPVLYLKEGSTDNYEEANYILSFDTKITPTKGWNIYGKYTYREYTTFLKEVAKKLTMSDNFGYRFPRNELWNGYAPTSYVYHRGIDSKRNSFDIYSDYELKLGNHYMKAMVGFNQEDYRRLQFSAEREDMINDNVPSLNLTNGEDHVGQKEYHWAVRGVFYRLNYSYKDKYLLDMNGRYDGTSRFPKSSRFGFFPSFSAAWRVSEENFMKSIDVLSNLKIRVSYGSLGNQDVPTYAYIAAMSAGRVSAMLDGDRPIGISPPGLVADNLTWETVNTINFGLDFGLFNHRFSGSFDWYNRKTLDMLTAGDAMPGILGAGAPQRNSADLSTKGWELILSWNDKIGDVSYGVRFTLADSRTYITKYDNPIGSFSSDYYEGKEIGEIWGYETAGFIADEATLNDINDNDRQQFLYGGVWKLGDIQYKDANGDGKVDRGAYTKDDHGDLKKIGNSRPRFNYGINLSAAWKGFTLSAFLQGVGKRDFMPSGYMFWPYADTWRNIQEHQLDTWTPENPNAYYPQMEGNAGRNFETQTKYLQNAAYLRLKDLSLSYSLPQSLLKKTFIEDIRLTLSGRNLFEITSLIEPFDPEGNTKSGAIYPFRRDYAVGVSIVF